MAGSSTYRLNFSRKALSDSGMDQVRRELPAAKGDLKYEEVDFSQNELTAVGLRTVVEVCCRCPKLRVLKLYKNRLNDEAAKGLAELCRKVPGIEEIHLSHNLFTGIGVEVMVTAAEDVRPEGMSPLWLRLEQNHVVEPESVFRDLVSKQLSVCQRTDEVRCTVRTCCKRQKIHLPFFHVQRQPLRAGYPAGPGGPTLPPSISRHSAAAAGSPTAGAPSVRATPKASPSVSTRPATNGNVWGLPRPAAQQPGASAQKPPEAPEKSPANAWGTSPAGSPANAWGVPAAAAAARAATAPEPEPAARPAPPQSPPEPAARPAPPQSSPEPAAQASAAGARRPDPPDLSAVVATPPTAAATPTTAAAPQAGSPTPKPLPRPDPPRQDAAPRADAGGGERDSGERGGAPAAAASADAKKAGPPAKSAQPAQENGQRPSLVLDSRGNRRIHRLQLEVDGASDQFICPICGFWLSSPLMSTCSHLFCQDCFSMWVAKEVEKAKKESLGKVPTISCPQPDCPCKLLKKDVTPFDRGANGVCNAGVSKVMQRLRNNIQIRCVHHTDHSQHPFGADAKRIQQEAHVSCGWMGDATSYQEHLKNCPVEQFILSPSAAKVEPQDQDPQGGDEKDRVRIVRHDYIPEESSKTQLELKANELVKIFEYTETGWAAGIRVCKTTKAEIGEAGWFPEGYLYPEDHAAKA